MKKTLVSLLTILLCGCSGFETFTPGGDRWVAPSANKIELTKAEQAVFAKDMTFGVSLFKDIAAAKGLDEDLLVSPISMSLTLSMLSAAAKGDTRDEIVNALGFEGMDYSDVASYYNKLSTGMVASGDSTVVCLANAVWAGVPLKQGFVEEAQTSYNADVAYLDFSNADKAAGTINGWTSEKTRGMIPQIVTSDELFGVAAILENAVYFLGNWSDGKYDKEERFYFNGINGNRSKIDYFTHKSDYCNSLFLDDISVLKLSYGNGSFNFMVVLPKEKIDFKKFVSSLTAKQWNEWSSACHSHKVEFFIPCFESECSMNKTLEQAIKKAGIKTVFENADLSNMVDGSLNVSKMTQKTKIKVSETGTEAAAATTVSIVWGASGLEADPYKTFVADRPFVYAIEEASTGTLLFIGAHVK